MFDIKCMEEFDPLFFQKSFRFTQDKFTEILSRMRDLDDDLFVDDNDNPHLIKSISKTPADYMRCWTDNALMILLLRLEFCFDELGKIHLKYSKVM